MDEATCPENSGDPHEPDWENIKLTSDGGEWYLDVTCRLCGREGTIGTESIHITW